MVGPRGVEGQTRRQKVSDAGSAAPNSVRPGVSGVRRPKTMSDCTISELSEIIPAYSGIRMSRILSLRLESYLSTLND